MTKVDEVLERKITPEDLKKQMLKDGFVENPGQRFNRMGMFEQTIGTGNRVVNKIASALKDEKDLKFTLIRGLKSDCNHDPENPLNPALIFTGEEITLRITIQPTDFAGNNGKSWIKKEVAEKLLEDYKNEGYIK